MRRSVMKTSLGLIFGTASCLAIASAMLIAISPIVFGASKNLGIHAVISALLVFLSGLCFALQWRWQQLTKAVSEHDQTSLNTAAQNLALVLCLCGICIAAFFALVLLMILFRFTEGQPVFG